MSTAPSGIVVPPGQHPPFATVTSTDHSAWIIVSAALGLSLTLLFAAIRVYTRSAISSGYGVDDCLVAAGTVLATVQSSFVLSACAQGLGKSVDILSAKALTAVQKSYYASDLLFVTALVLSKAAIAMFLLRLTPVRSHRRFLKGVLGVLLAWGVALLFATALRCNLAHPWIIMDEQCAAYELRWQILEAVGCLYEAIVSMMAIWLVWDLQTNLDNKVVVIAAFGFRLGMIIIVSLRLASFNAPGFASDPTLSQSQFIAWTSAELNYSLISATIPIIRPFVTNLSTNYGGGQGSSGNGHGGRSEGGYIRTNERTKGHSAFEMRSLQRSNRNRDSDMHALEDTGYGVHVYGESRSHRPNATLVSAARKVNNGDATSVGSNESQKMIIRKDVTWRVEQDSDMM